LQQLLILAVVIAFFDLLVPRGPLQRYVRLTVSFMILLTLLLPIGQFVQGDVRAWMRKTERMLAAQTESERTRSAPLSGDAATGTTSELQQLHEEQVQTLFAQRLGAELRVAMLRDLQVAADVRVQMESLSKQTPSIALVAVTVSPSKLPSIPATDETALVEPIRITPFGETTGAVIETPPRAATQQAQITQFVKQFATRHWSLEVRKVTVEEETQWEG
jgi:hypothetical protein